MLSVLLSVALLHWLVLIIPGANVLVVSQLAASRDRKSACYAALGISVVALTWALLAILGVNALFAALPAMRFAVQVAGGVYLCYLAVRLWRSGSTAPEAQAPVAGAWAAFRLGFLTNIGNPQTALFFGSVFATALPNDHTTALLAAAVSLVFINALVCHVFLAFAFSQPGIQAGYLRQRKALSRVAGAVIGVFGLRLVAAAASEIKT